MIFIVYREAPFDMGSRRPTERKAMHHEVVEIKWEKIRRYLGRLGLVLQAVIWLAACSSPTPEATRQIATQAVSSAPACSNPAALTPALTEGPYFKASSPERASLVDANAKGIQLTLTGTVLTTNCKPVAHALLDFWQANADGQYDNTGYTLRGHQYTDENGRYQLVTVVPGLYPGRTEHIHFKVQAPNGPILTSQLFFPGVSNNESDSIFDPLLVIHITQEDSRSMQATFNFIIDGG
jgi:protocatechuate 3,4-dioxygenase beta subunit